ncbi:MAG: hypothetical protein G01um1014106_76 [Parcubacteria group bacterium Gr01-1014_106]|nr:MAG: hypothetical protein G01um1014106_76 [Parcubacteria group bacterium Gr01-1014_106]
MSRRHDQYTIHLMRQGELRTETAAPGGQGMLMRRPSLDLWIHDRVAATVAAQAVGYAAYTNIGGHHSMCLTGSFREVSPDVVICDPESFLVDHVVEVEVEDTIQPDTAQRWLDIARAIQGRGVFWILVQPSAIASARQLCDAAGIAAHIGTWSINGDTITITWPVPLRAAPVRH